MHAGAMLQQRQRRIPGLSTLPPMGAATRSTLTHASIDRVPEFDGREADLHTCSL